jgi:glutathione synthase
MDPMETVLTAKDTTFAMMLACSARGHECHHALPLNLEVLGGDVYAPAARVQVSRKPRKDGFFDDDWKKDVPVRARVADFDAVLIRKDPPFDANYAYMTHLLELVRGKTLVLNDPQGLRDANEKLYTLHFTRWMPKTMVTATPSRIKEFVVEVGGQAVIKPLDGMAGAGVFLLRADDRNFNAIVEARIGEMGTTFCMVQEYLPAARQGDKRILILDGEPLGAILRVPRDDEARANIHTGGSVVKAEITKTERAMIEDLTPKLRQDGLFFVGLDVIGEKLTEVNVTSPTGIQQMMRLDGVDYAARFVEWLEKRA